MTTNEDEFISRDNHHLPGEYRPIYVNWSDDMGKAWTRPVETNPHLMNISPELVTLDNGHTWQDRISFSDLPCDVITGQFNMIKVGPNRLVAVGNDAEGTKVWAFTVERVKSSATHAQN